MSDIFNTITGEDWKRSIADGRARENKVVGQIHSAVCKVDRPHPLTYHCAYSKEWRSEKCIHCPHSKPNTQGQTTPASVQKSNE